MGMKICGKCLPEIREGTYEIRISVQMPKNSPFAKDRFSSYETYEVELCEKHFDELNMTLIGLGLVK
jgi:hypothetical protein